MCRVCGAAPGGDRGDQGPASPYRGWATTVTPPVPAHRSVSWLTSELTRVQQERAAAQNLVVGKLESIDAYTRRIDDLLGELARAQHPAGKGEAA